MPFLNKVAPFLEYCDFFKNTCFEKHLRTTAPLSNVLVAFQNLLKEKTLEVFLRPFQTFLMNFLTKVVDR